MSVIEIPERRALLPVAADCGASILWFSSVPDTIRSHESPERGNFAGTERFTCDAASVATWRPWTPNWRALRWELPSPGVRSFPAA